MPLAGALTFAGPGPLGEARPNNTSLKLPRR